MNIKERIDPGHITKARHHNVKRRGRRIAPYCGGSIRYKMQIIKCYRQELRNTKYEIKIRNTKIHFRFL